MKTKDTSWKDGITINRDTKSATMRTIMPNEISRFEGGLEVPTLSVPFFTHWNTITRERYTIECTIYVTTIQNRGTSTISVEFSKIK
jgi:hypothetical protein